MFELFKAEFLRYRKWAILVFIGQLAVWSFVAKIKPLLAPNMSQTALMNALTLLGGFSFGLVQIIMLRRKNNWTYLIQRPLHLSKIYRALSAAAVANIIIAVPLAWVLVVFGLDTFTNTVVDARHYIYGFYLTGVTITAYLIGSLTALSASRGAIGLFILTILWIYPKPDNMVFFFSLLTLMMGGLWYLNLKCFKPDLNTHVQTPIFTILMGIPMQATIAFLLIMASTFYYHIPRFIMGNHPDNNPIEGSMGYIWHVDEKNLVEYLLKDQDIPNKDRLARQAKLADVGYITPQSRAFPKQNQMPIKDKNYGLYDGETRTRWVFDNDKMLMQGQDALTGDIKGWLGKNGFMDTNEVTENDTFDSVPFLLADQFLVTPTRLYQVNYEDHELIVKFEIDEGDKMVNPPQINDDFVAIVSEASTFIFDKEDFLTEMEPIEANYVIPHPIAVDKLREIRTRRMVDGYLLIYISPDYNGHLKAATSLYYARLDKGVEQIARVDFPNLRHPAIILDLEYVISPAIHILNNTVLNLLEPSEKSNATISEVLAREYRSSVQWAALLLQILSALGVLVLARRIKLNTTMIGVWTVMAAIFSLPVLISFLFMNKVRGQ